MPPDYGPTPTRGDAHPAEKPHAPENFLLTPRCGFERISALVLVASQEPEVLIL